ncbi:MAG: class D sortase [Anaerolineaceae bacterium]|nr:class D sortase [Anaerolineaceae bacterium]MBN2678127.1 class D sortase [Anaerolineaceae bacterium]
MNPKKSENPISESELQRLLKEQKHARHQARLEHYRRIGRVVGTPPIVEGTPNSSRKPRRKWVDRLLLGIEIAAVIGLLIITANGVGLIRTLNREVINAIQQPTLTPTPLYRAVILPSGHTPPNSAGGARYNEEEIPEHLRPVMQAMASLALPTPSARQATRIQIAAIGVDAPVVQGDGWEQLKKGVGQHPFTPDPGQPGNIVLSAHNDVFGELFRDLDKLKPGDTIVLFSPSGQFVYIVTGTQIVAPTNVQVMNASEGSTVTLISCYPYMVDNKRIVISAKLQGNP